MAKKPEPVAIVSAFGKDVRFGKGDKVIKLPLFRAGPDQAWKVADLSLEEFPTAVGFVSIEGETFVAEFSEYPTAVQRIMGFHGAKQKLGDEYADLDSPADCLEAVRALHARLMEGKWTVEREGFAGVSVLMRALMKAYNLDEDAAREFLKPLSKKEKDALRVCDELKPFIEEIERERGKGVDAKGLLAKLPKAA